MDRLTEALGRIAETRRTALGLVMSLDDGYLKFDFDRAELRPESREVLSRIAGILFTADGFVITVSGHTDARGTTEYNQALSTRRAQAVADYLIGAGLPGDLFTVQGLGKSQPLDPGNTEEAHATNRRVELGLVSARIVESPVLGRRP
ncbi:MAG: OmpA family protein [Acidobacteria bacterium]|nr:OmpA family protein [Acidobacteriota bacterium]